ncbi:hypothetical protein GCM10010172_51640 [Paractinoplanes ferrugineus]|uniref:Protein NO VEIN C-terminal domain-containing protein n=1 Tax=Paractinoplanes ferrugineus TaxID=113564 RepID=A0A919MLA5_9ACTN|nr:DUF3883 domain-containing protein [Actinoplanes ferrugineus]GIE12017.1 hypothetical protein Afe05nite_38570 [Actinoplanes ferrugineus]
MPIPPEPTLRAAVRWLERLPQSGVARCRALFTNHRDFSDLTPTQYEVAYAWLATTGLLDSLVGPDAPAQRVFTSAISTGGTTWLQDFDVLVRTVDELPEDALLAAEALGISRPKAFEHVSALWGKVDTEERARIGLAGELALFRLIKANVPGDVTHVAANCDGLGYDIAVSSPTANALIEVKSTRRQSRATIYLSRNEFETMRREPTWTLVLLRLDIDMEIVAINTVTRTWIEKVAPIDSSIYARWETARIEVSPDQIRRGIIALPDNISLL